MGADESGRRAVPAAQRDAAAAGAPQLGRYVLGACLGEGPTGVVYAAIDPELDRRVAIKIVREAPAQATARLVHRNLVTIHDVGTVGDRWFVAMEFIDGPTLRQWLRGGHPWREVVAALVQAGCGLAAAHDAGVVHGDFRAENVLLAGDGRVVVTDFGLGGTSSSTPAADAHAFCVALRDALVDRGPPRWLRRIVARGCAVDPAERFDDMHGVLRALSPPRRWSPGVMAAGAGALATIAVVAITVGRPDPVPATWCGRVAERIEGIWSAEQQRELESAFLATGQPAAADAWKMVATRVDAFAAAWIEVQLDACRAQQDGSVAAEIVTLRVTCLERQLAKAEEVLAALHGAGDETVLRSSEVVAGLGTPTHCVDDAQLSRREQARANVAPGTRAELDRALLRAEALVDTAHYAEALTSASALVQLAGGAGDRGADGWVVAEALLVVASARQWLADPEAEQAFHDALSGALAVGHQRVAALSMLGLLELWRPGTEGGIDRAEQWRGHVEALITALGGDAALQAELDAAIGSIYLKGGRYDDATRAYERAITRQDLADKPVLFANVYANLGGIAAAHGRLGEALERFRRGREVLEGVVGSRHPATASATINIGSALAELGDLEGARAEHLRALEVLEENFGPDHPALAPALRMLAWSGLSRRAWAEALPFAERALAIAQREDPRGESTARSLTMLAAIELELGHLDDAFAHVQAGLAIALETLGADHPASAEFEIDYALVVTRRGDEAAAREHLARAIALREAAFGATDSEVGRAWAATAELELAAGRHGAAVDAATRAHDIARAGATERGVGGAEASFLLARCLMAGGDADERARARRLAAEARAEFAAAGPAWRAHAEAIDTWFRDARSG